jgi:nitrate/nitrite transport system ATP-binding protein
LERPRDRLALAEDPKYNHYRAEVVKFLHQRHNKRDEMLDNESSDGEQEPVLSLVAS